MTNIYKDNWKRYKEIGLTPFPASRKSKSPIPKWKDDNPPPSDEDFKSWENKYGDANLWVLLGPGHAVLEDDGPGANAFIDSLNLPDGPTSISGKKSTHRCYKISSPLKPIKATNGGDKTFLELRTGSLGMLAPRAFTPKVADPIDGRKGIPPGRSLSLNSRPKPTRRSWP